VKNLSRLKVAIVDPGRTRTAMRAKAYPGENPAANKDPGIVADAVAELLTEDFDTGICMVVEG
jgi:hypothetical protein